jgi:hypothetical protein
MTAIRLTVGPVSADLLVPRSRLEYVARWYRNGVAWEEREIEVERKALVAQR